MKNSFQEWQDTLEQQFPLPEELEGRVMRQADTFSFFGKVVELFIPNALQTVARMIGADSPEPSPKSNRPTNSPENEPEWRSKPQGPSGNYPGGRR